MADEKDFSEDSEHEGRLSETIKKIVTAGLGAAFMTEEHIRNYMGELKIPKDVLQTLINSATKSKEELMERVGDEFIKIISRIDFVKEASRFVEEHKFKVTAEVEVIKKDDSESDSSGGMVAKINLK